MIIVGEKCQDCIYADIDDSNKAKIIVHCDFRDKKYFWGQCISCEDYKKNEQNNDRD